ncbi:phosphoadenosine phosphosulfate reductase family protein [Candidatus Methylospira mobilis]|uniref:Phosphoadenosine phosphosulfate reductase family protein n=1 Tax=Candidatus Methylospira mobilis TaxID=1808979 RepID=A0A5Q0BGN5_9GAMM|nr:phosphoadenosine phosphosulfate reductase family protein [Candidatus Methylospira mobilis]QFY42970.1 phosphoadenosine phosphosulfate reductase family protein [Candidatus Methylospira mobilis]
MSVLHVVSVSGGKDSDATLFLALNRYPKSRVIPCFADTGNEHDAVYEHLDYLEAALDIKIVRLKANFERQIARKRLFIARDQRTGRDDRGRKLRWSNKSKRRALEALHPTGNPYLDLCMWKGRFPSRKAQFCTQELKRDLLVNFQMDLVDAGHRVVSWQGVRRDESLNRRNAKLFERLNPRLYAYRPLVDWTAQQVFDYLRERRLIPNTLYKQGMSRVGCMPCINANKNEIAQIAARFPGHIQRIAEWERLVCAVSKRGFATFFNKELHTDKGNDQHVHATNCIESVVDYARTTRGGKQYGLFESHIDVSECASAYGLCE